jgi:hypothetical protein
MKIHTKEIKEGVYLIYVKDDNGNPIECLEANTLVDKDNAENQLGIKYNCDEYLYTSVEEFQTEKKKECEITNNLIEKPTHPLILVFYIDRETLINREIIKPLAESIDETIKLRGYNIISFFLPTDGEEKIECLNPVLIDESKMDQVNRIVSDIQTTFSLGVNIGDSF